MITITKLTISNDNHIVHLMFISYSTCTGPKVAFPIAGHK